MPKALPVDHQYFDRIDTEAKAYWLGFINADGNIGWTGDEPRRVSLALAPVDRGHIVKFKQAIGSHHKIVDHVRKSGQGYSALMFTSRKMARDFRQLGVIADKSCREVAPPEKHLPRHLVRHFWRGMVDGDGSLYWMKEKVGGPAPCVAFIGSRSVMDSLLLDMSEAGVEIGTKPRGASKTQPSLMEIDLRRWPAIQAADYLYRDCTVSLDRKQILYEQFMGWADERGWARWGGARGHNAVARPII